MSTTETALADIQKYLAEHIHLIRDDRILVRPEPMKQQVLGGGLMLPDSMMKEERALSQFRTGYVVACGPGMGVQGDPDKRYPMEVKPGDRIVHHKAARDTIFINGEGFLLIGNRDVSLVISEDVDIVQIVIKPAGVPG